MQPAVTMVSQALQPEARRVVRGYVDLFIAPLLDNGEPGERYHLVRADIGDPLFPVELAEGRGFVLIEASAPDLDTEELGPTPQSHDVDRWVTILTSAGGGPRPVSPRILPAGLFQAEAAGMLVTDGVRWVCPLAGSARFNDTLELRRGAWFPLAPGAFVAVSEDCELDCVGTDVLLGRGIAPEGLAEFHRTMLGCLALRLLQQMEQSAERLQRRAASEKTIFHRAFRELVSESGDRALPVVASDADPLRLACHAVWTAADIVVGRDRPTHVPDALRGGPAERQQKAAEVLARGAGVRVRRVQLSGDWWKQECGPLLAWTSERDAPVALLPKSRGYEMVEPLSGRRIAVTRAVARTIDASAMMFYRPIPDSGVTLGGLFRFGFERRHSELWRCAASGATAGLLPLLVPVATGILIDYVIPSGDRKQLVVMSALLLTAAIVSAAFLLTRQIAVLRLEMAVASELIPAIWDRLLRLPVSFFRRFTVGDLAHRAVVFDDTRRTVAHSIALSVFTGVSALFQIGLLIAVDVKLALIALGLVAVACVVSVVAAKSQTESQEQIAAAQGKLAGRVLQLLTGVAKFRASGAERRMFVLWAEQFREFKLHGHRVRIQTNRTVVFQSVFPVVGCMLLFATAGQTGSEIPAGAFVAFLSAFLQTLSGVVEVSTAWTRAVAYLPPLTRVRPILESAVEVQRGQESPGELSGAIDVSHVQFRYGPGQPLVLKDLSFRVEPGQMVAFVGDSGAGKSTLIRLLLGFDTPEGGTIRYDGQDLRNLDIQAVRRQMGVVLQSGRLLSSDIFSNIVGATGLGVEDAWEAARLAGIQDEIRAMPMGMYTLAGDGGSNLSGGQRQRLLLARAIVARPPILLLDEATSALDNETQAVVTRSLAALRATRIVIAHRLSTIQSADRIFVLDGGRIAESGTFEDLMKQRGKFARLAERQLL